MKFEQGIFYTFKILGIINVPERGDHYVLLHGSGRKMLLKSEYYVKYNYEIGQYIDCKIDKVNCTGQVFLEPRHPHYIEGKEYLFNKISIQKKIDNTLNLLVKDLFDNEIELFINQNQANLNDEKISLKVERVKKGLPILSFPKTQEVIANKYLSELIEFIIIASVIENSEEYYSLEDSLGRINTRLKVKHYKHYGFKIGQRCFCRVIGTNANGLMQVEPENPWYKVGESYVFKINSIESYIDLEDKEVKSIILLDNANNKSGIVLKEKEIQQIGAQNEIRCKVIGFRKGRPQLEIDL